MSHSQRGRYRRSRSTRLGLVRSEAAAREHLLEDDLKGAAEVPGAETINEWLEENKAISLTEVFETVTDFDSKSNFTHIHS